MTESRGAPYTWVGQEVHLIHQTGNDRRGVNYTLAEVNDLGVCLEGSADSFLSLEQHPEDWPRPSTTEQAHELVADYSPNGSG